MSAHHNTFPSTTLHNPNGGLPVEINLINQLSAGMGDQLYTQACQRQAAHSSYIDALDEPSAKLGGMHLDRGDPSSLYTFAVGANGHPFHKHAGHRVFTAISGSAGTQLRFSFATDADIAENTQSFFEQLHCVHIPPDCLFTVRFGGETWHQFVPDTSLARHPAFFALSCHTNELGGDLSEHTRQEVMANNASIPSLTTLLPHDLQAQLEKDASLFKRAHTTRLSFSAHTLHALLSNAVRCGLGLLKAQRARCQVNILSPRSHRQTAL